MNPSENKKPKVDVKPLTNTELTLYAALVLATAVAQFLFHGGKSLAETLAWVIVYAFLLAVVFFGWARSKPETSSESEK